MKETWILEAKGRVNINDIEDVLKDSGQGEEKKNAFLYRKWRKENHTNGGFLFTTLRAQRQCSKIWKILPTGEVKELILNMHYYSIHKHF